MYKTTLREVVLPQNVAEIPAFGIKCKLIIFLNGIC